jgi:hypothetical protein
METNTRDSGEILRNTRLSCGLRVAAWAFLPLLNRPAWLPFRRLRGTVFPAASSTRAFYPFTAQKCYLSLEPIVLPMS